ncbi:MAG TPA: NlpC/P60 family protein [Actinomycetota bacterium]|nr:NlpC/P60 family protein [Actinomycetota bacterium]
MAKRGHGLRRRLTPVVLLTLTVTLAQSLAPTPAQATPPSWTEGEHGSGPAPFPAGTSRAERLRIPSMTWTDLGSDDMWAKPAINHVAGTYDWMRDFAPDAEGNWRFKPDAFESRKRWARALVRAFAPDEEPDPSVTFPDLDPADPFHGSAAIAVQRGWLTRGPSGRFSPDELVTARSVNRSLVVALGMGSTARALNRLATTAGYRFDTPPLFGANLLAMRLGLRFNNKSDESQDVTPNTLLRRKQVAWSLYRATTIESWVVPSLEDQYAGMVLPKMTATRRSIVDWGVRYVGYPYIWAGEWGFDSPSPAAFGSQPGPGFDCSGLSWWALRADDNYWDISPPRPYKGWSLPQRSSAEMSRMTKNRLAYADVRPGDLMFYDGDDNGVVDHVDVYVGNGWALDSSSSVGGVTLMWVKTGWYRQHFVHGRRILS